MPHRACTTRWIGIVAVEALDALARWCSRRPHLIKPSEHGLGHLLNPTDPDSEDRDWIRQLWDGIVHDALGLPHTWPEWLDRPAIGRIAASSPTLLQPFTELNRSKPYIE